MCFQEECIDVGAKAFGGISNRAFAKLKVDPRSRELHDCIFIRKRIDGRDQAVGGFLQSGLYKA